MSKRNDYGFINHPQEGPMYHYEIERSLWDRARFYVIAFVIATVIVSAVFLVSIPRAHAQGAYPANLWKGLIAEATSDGYDGMYAVCCVVRNRLDRGMNTGLCGLKRKDLGAFVKREGEKREKEAREIIAKVFEQGAEDVTQGATHFESVRYKTPSWARGAVKTCRIGEHVFYRGVK